MQATLLITTLASILFLAFYGAGIYTWTLYVTAIPLSLAAIYTHLHHPHTHNHNNHTRPFPPSIPTIHIAILAFITLTLLPLPTTLTIISGPQRAHQNRNAAEIISEAHHLDLSQTSTPLFSDTRNRAGTLRFLLTIAAIYSAFNAARLLSPRARNICLHTIIAIGTIIAIAGYISYKIIPQGNRLWWLIKVPPFHRPPVGSFLNLNHYAGYIAMLSTAALAAAISHLRSKRYPEALLTFTAALTMAILVILSASRGATLALAAGLTLLTAYAVSLTRGRIRIIALAVITITLLAITTAALHNTNVQNRLRTLRHPLTDYSVQPRISAWKGALKVWAHYPILGAGANAFRFTYPQHKDKQFRAYRRFAENEPLHILAEGGIIGFSLTALLLTAIILAITNRRPMPQSETIPSALIAITAIITALTHSSVDFIMHLPLYTITLAVIIAICIPQKNSRHTTLAAALTLIILITLIPFKQPLTNYDTNGCIVAADSTRLTRLLTWSPTNPMILRRLAANFASTNTPESLKLAEKTLTLAADYDPTNFEIWTALGKLQLKLGKKNAARQSFRNAKQIRSWAPTPTI